MRNAPSSWSEKDGKVGDEKMESLREVHGIELDLEVQSI
jgi:hypothetical protein